MPATRHPLLPILEIPSTACYDTDCDGYNKPPRPPLSHQYVVRILLADADELSNRDHERDTDTNRREYHMEP